MGYRKIIFYLCMASLLLAGCRKQLDEPYYGLDLLPYHDGEDNTLTITPVEADDPSTTASLEIIPTEAAPTEITPTQAEDDGYHQPDADDFITAVFHEKIKDDMPVFTFELLAYYDESEGEYIRESLAITDSSTGKVVQEITIPELSLFGRTHVFVHDGETMGFELEDLNFDGYKDIRLFDTTNGNYREEWIYLVWIPDKYIFENDKRLNDVTLAVFDQDKQLIYGMERSSAADHWYYTYKYVDGELVLIELESDNAVGFPDGVTDEQVVAVVPILEDHPSWCIQHVVNKKLNPDTSEMEIVEEKYVLYIPNEWTLIAEYDADSAEGRELAQLIEGSGMVGPTEAPTANVYISVATDEDLENYDLFYKCSDNEDSMWGWWAIISTDTEVREFAYYSIMISDDYGDDEDPFIVGDIRFSVDVLTYEKPFLVKVVIPGIYPTSGVSFLDENGVTKYYAIMDDYGDEYPDPPYYFIEFEN